MDFKQLLDEPALLQLKHSDFMDTIPMSSVSIPYPTVLTTMERRVGGVPPGVAPPRLPMRRNPYFMLN